MSGYQQLAGFRQIPQEVRPDARGLLRVVFEAVVPVGVIKADRKHGITGERQRLAAGRQADDAVPGV